MSTTRFPRTATTSAARTGPTAHTEKFDPTRGDGRMELVDLVGKVEVKAIIASKSIEFLATGDTGRGLHTEQETVVDAMARDVDVHKPAAGPTFLCHLGDIIYGPDKSPNYANKFYRPNQAWLQPAEGFKGIILGIPGNHDGELRDPRDIKSLNAFLENFCTAHPPMAASFNAVMPNQPGPYWFLDAPFLDLIGLYSNADENIGVLGADAADTKQRVWLESMLRLVAAARKKGERKALVIVTHHPPYSQGLHATGSGHPGSPAMLAEIDAACQAAGVWPDLFLSGHAHNYQRYMRTLKLAGGQTKVIPYLVVGTGGYGSQPVPANLGSVVEDARGSVKYANARGAEGRGADFYGYVRIHASAKVIQATMVQTIEDHRNELETVAIDLVTGQETKPEFEV